MKITAYLTNGGRVDWDEPDDFNLVLSVKLWRSDGYIQAPNFYISMGVVGFIVIGENAPKFQLPEGVKLQ